MPKNLSRYHHNIISSIHLELTSHCNAQCPMCSRNVHGNNLRPGVIQTEISYDLLLSIFDRQFSNQLNDVFFCGNFGDPTLYKNLLLLLKHLRSLNPNLYLHMHTNGSMHDENWWKELAAYFQNGLGSITFGIDGLKNTHSHYRRGTDFNKIMQNARAFIQAGGEARWHFLLFKHNEHELMEISRVAKEEGFKSLTVRSSGRFYSEFDQQFYPKFPMAPILNNKEEWLEPSTSTNLNNQALNQIQSEMNDNNTWKHRDNGGPITCPELKKKRVYISSQGYLFPCCFLAKESDLRHIEGEGSIHGLLQVEDLNLYKHSIENIINTSDAFRIIERSWSACTTTERLKTCAFECNENYSRMKNQDVSEKVFY